MEGERGGAAGLTERTAEAVTSGVHKSVIGNKVWTALRCRGACLVQCSVTGGKCRLLCGTSTRACDMSHLSARVLCAARATVQVSSGVVCLLGSAEWV